MVGNKRGTFSYAYCRQTRPSQSATVQRKKSLC